MSIIQLSNEDLITKLRSGDKNIFNDYFHLHYATLCNYALRFVSNHNDAEDAVQHVFVQLWENRKKLKVEVPLNGFLYKATKNHCLNKIKHLKVRKQHADDVKAKNQLSVAPTYEDVEYLELHQHVAEAVASLPERCRMVFLLSRDEQLSYKEIAEKMKISVKTVETQMGKALKNLRISLSDYLLFIILIIFN